MSSPPPTAASPTLDVLLNVEASQVALRHLFKATIALFTLPIAAFYITYYAFQVRFSSTFYHIPSSRSPFGPTFLQSSPSSILYGGVAAVITIQVIITYFIILGMREANQNVRPPLEAKKKL